MMGGHNPSPGIYKISYLDSLKNLTADHSDWSPSQIRKEAAIRFRPRFRQDKASSIQEARNEAMSPGPEFILKDGEVYYPAYGMSANELNENTLRLNPSEYSLAQHQTTAVMSEAFRNGATEVVAAYHREGEDHRDLIVMKYDPVTGKGKMTIVNTAQDGNFHKFQDMQSVAKSQFVTHYEMRPANNVFILSDKPLAHQKVQKALGYVEQRIALVLREPDRHVADVKLEQQKRERRDEVYRVEQVFQSERLSLTKVREKPVRIADIIQKRHKEMTETKHALRVVAETHVAVGAVPLLITALTKEVPKPMVAIEKSIARHGKKEVKHRQQDIRRKQEVKTKESEVQKKKFEIVMKKPVFHTMSKELKIQDKKERIKRRNKRARKILREKNVIKLSEKRIEKPLFSRKEKRQKKQQERLSMALFRLARKISKIEKRLVFTLETRKRPQIKRGLHLEKPHLTDVAPKKARHVEKKVRRERQKEAVVRFSFAWTFWLLLKMSALREHIHNTDTKDEKQEALIQKEPAPWILLSIIWYLAMIRESGAQNAQKAKVKKKKKSYQSARLMRLPPAGIIFAYAS